MSDCVELEGLVVFDCKW